MQSPQPSKESGRGDHRDRPSKKSGHGRQAADKTRPQEQPVHKIDRGVYVYEVFPGGAAHKAGMRDGDIILEVEGLQVNKVAAVQAFLSEKSPGDTLKVKVLREIKRL